MKRHTDRRELMLGVAAAFAGGSHTEQRALAETAVTNLVAADLGPPQPFSFETLTAAAKAAALKPWIKAVAPDPALLERIDYDAYQKIRFRPERSLDLDGQRQTPVQLFHLGKYATEPVQIYDVKNGEAREVIYSGALFETPPDHPARGLKRNVGFAGFRVMAPDLKTDWYAAMGASYFRTSGPYNQYGLSARGLAIDTAMPTAEEFPRFAKYWLEGGNGRDTALTIYGELDGPSITGAYKMVTERSTDYRDIHRIVMTIEARIFARKDIARLGIAPFSSMFWYGEASRKQASDWRPEIHDSDGLAIWTGSGERIWRPINNPPRVMTSAFVDNNPKGFGLLQRDRDFVHYLDDGVFYERRASVWVEPLDGWGDGAVHLVEIPTDDETHDNIVAYWCPAKPMQAGDSATFRYRLTWLDDIEFQENVAKATATWTGVGGRPGHKRPDGVRKFVIDWQGPVFQGLDRKSGVELVVTASRGTVSNAYTHPVVDQRERWRSLFDIQADGEEPIDLRAYLKLNGNALTETWIYQYFSGQ